MIDPTNKRKLQHLDIVASDRYVDRQKGYFDDIYLRHRALPELDLDDIDSSTTFMEKSLSFPLLISSMTGGDHDRTRKINRNLALAAEKTSVAMGVGSQRVMFNNPAARASFELREQAPSTLLFANLGAIQLNYGFTPKMCRDALRVLDADGLYLHLNPLQEAIQPEGETRFAGLADKIFETAQLLDKPVIIKEVGAGMGREDVHLLAERGIRFIDVAGAGGTSWSRIEQHRKEDDKDIAGLVFQDWGIPTPLAIDELRRYEEDVTIIGSGGIRTGIDMVKALVLGASLCGVAAPFLMPALESVDAVVERIYQLKREFITAMFLLGIDNVENLKGNVKLILRWNMRPPSSEK